MIVTVHLHSVKRETRTIELENGATVDALIRTLGLLPDSWIATREGEPVPTDRKLEDGDEVKLISVVSGG
ncbi:MAG: MoaD/ThiS family protein [Methanobacteriota archaeon]|nr:MAG: MoaD/ThiS family protein [Euryarchaeota archaeon]